MNRTGRNGSLEAKESQFNFHLAFASPGCSVVVTVQMRKIWSKCNLFLFLRVPWLNTSIILNDKPLIQYIS